MSLKRQYFVISDVANGIAMLSKSFSGKSSTIVVMKAISMLKMNRRVKISTATRVETKHVRLPMQVLHLKIHFFLPNTLPTKLASPSPKLKARIEIVAIYIGKKYKEIIIPKLSVTGPKEKRFSSRFLLAKETIREMR